MSDALSGGGRLREDTRVHVREVAARLGYRPSALARGLRKQQGGLLGLVVIPQTSASLSTVAFWANLLSNAAEESLNKGYALVLLPPDPEFLSSMRFPVDGVIVVDPVRNDPVLKVLRDSGIALVTLGRDLSGSPEPWIDDDIRGGVLALLETVSTPGDRVALVTLPATKSYLQDTLTGVMAWPGHAPGHPIVHTLTSIDPEEVRQVTDQLIKNRVDVVLGANDRITLALLRELQSGGLNVPQDVLLASLVDAPELERCNPPITALVQHPAEAAKGAVDALIDKIAGRPVPSTTLVPGVVAPRSSAPARS